jgi:hypothetical protein
LNKNIGSRRKINGPLNIDTKLSAQPKKMTKTTQINQFSPTRKSTIPSNNIEFVFEKCRERFSPINDSAMKNKVALINNM